MGVAESIIREMANKSRKFYECVLPPVDIHRSESMLTIKLDMPGFEKEQIKLSIDGRMLTVSASRPDEERSGIVCSQRPRNVHKNICLPIHTEEGVSARYSNGVLTVSIPLSKSGTDIPVE